MKPNDLVLSRHNLLKDVIKHLDDETSRYIHIFSGRGMGKTRFLKSLDETLRINQDHLVFYRRFLQGFDKSLNEWIENLIAAFPSDYRLFDSNKEPTIRFERILSKLKNSNYVESPKSIFLLLDDFHWINKNPDFKKFYNYFEKLFEEPDMTNLYIIASTLRNYSQKISGGSPFFLKCNFTISLKPFNIEDLKSIFSESRENLIKEIRDHTGGHPDLIDKILNLIEFNTQNLTKESLNKIWQKLPDLISIKQLIHPLNDDEIQTLVDIVKFFDYDNSIKLIDLQEITQGNKTTIQHIKSIEDTGLLEESESEIAIVGEIIRKKIQDEFFLESNIYDILENRLKIKEEFNLLGIREGKRIFGWASSDQNKDKTSFFPYIDYCNTIALAIEIASLANTASGVICFGIKPNESPLQIVTEKQIDDILQNTRNLLNFLPEYLISSFVIEGKSVGSLLVAKSKEKVLVDDKYFIKVDGFPFEIKDESFRNITPDYFISSRTGFLFIPSIWRFPKDQLIGTTSPIPYDQHFLEDDSAVNLFIEWLRNNRGEGVMIEFKYRMSEKRTEFIRVAEQIVAMANTKSGVLVIGVEETGNGNFDFVSVQDLDREERLLRRLEDDNRTRNIEGEFQRIIYNGNTLLLYFIRKPKMLASFEGRVFKRKGGQKSKVKLEDIARFQKEIFSKNPEGYLVISDIKKWISGHRI